jgi:hypothetical protein
MSTMMMDRDLVCRRLKRVAERCHPDQEVTRTIASPEELERLWRLDSTAYGNCTIPFAQLLDWWRAYPKGITALFHETAIQGAIEIWPLTRSVAQRLHAGEISEKEITAQNMLPLREAPCANWYLSGMMLRRMQRKTTAVKSLLVGTCAIFVAQSRLQFPLTISALGYSREGICFLRRFGFRKLKSDKVMPDRCPLYALEIKTWEDGVRFMRSRCLLGGGRVKRRPSMSLAAH